MKQPVKDQIVIPGVKPEILRDLDREAEKQDRSRSSMVRRILEEWHRQKPLQGGGGNRTRSSHQLAAA